MFANPLTVYLIVVLIGLVPGAISWWSGRRLVRSADDPALPELLVAHRRRNRAIVGFPMAGIGCIAVLSGSDIFFPIMVGALVAYAGLVAAAYPLRRALYHETWGFLSYCVFYPRAILGFFGFWLLVGALPGLAALAGSRDWILATGLGLVLVVWNIRHADIIRWCLRTRPIPEGDLLAGCHALANACALPKTRFERIDLRGGVVANALALPSLRTSSVLFTDTLLERFDRQEILAICAHELAHFDHYNPARLRRFNIVNYLLIALGVAAAPLTRAAGTDWGVLAAMLWLATVVTSIAMRAHGKQRQETACDLRAVELTGDAEAMIRGLTKLCTIARAPRRLDRQIEQSGTHPSLARRIRDIRKAAGSLPVPLSSARSFTSADGRATVTFDDAGVRWVERDVVTHTLLYGNLTELRVEAKPDRSVRLVAVGAEARRWELTLEDADVSSVQGVLDLVDCRLADPPRPPTVNPRVHRVVVLGIASIVLAFSQIAVAFVAFLVWLRPTVPLLVGAGAATLAAAALVLRDYGIESSLVAMSLPLAVIGLLFFGLAWRQRDAPRGEMRHVIALLVLATACSLVAVTTNGVDIVRLHRGARTVPSATVLLAALAGALVCSTTRRERLAGAAVASLALATVSVASTTFLDRFAADPFVVDAPPILSVALDSDPIQAFDVPSDTSRIDLSPSGRFVAVYQNDDDDDERPTKVRIGRVGDALTTIQADAVAFVGDEQLLIVRSDSHGTVLTAEQLSTSREVVWQRTVEDLSSPVLSLDRVTGRWDLLGWEREEYILRVQGMVGGSAVEEARWPVTPGRDGYVAAFTTAGPDALVLETRYERGLLARMLPWRWTWAHILLPSNRVSRYATVTAHGRRTFGETKLDVDCVADVMPQGELACTAYDGSRTRIVSISPGSDRVEGVGMLDGHFVTDQRAVRGWLTGWAGGSSVAIHLSSGEAFHMPQEARTGRLVPVAGDRLAALVLDENHLAVKVYAPWSDTGSTDALRDRPTRQIQTRLR